MISTTLQPISNISPRQLLLEVFDETDLPHLRYHNWQWYRSVMEYKVFSFLGAPVRLMSHCRQIVQMIHLAAMLNESTTTGAADAQTTEPNSERTALPDDQAAADRAFILGLGRLYEAYNGYVIHLFEKEANDPPLFFRRFFRHRNQQAWLELLDEWLECGLDKVGMVEFSDAVDEMPEALELMQGLCEACWLLFRKEKQEEQEVEANIIHSALQEKTQHNDHNDIDSPVVDRGNSLHCTEPGAMETVAPGELREEKQYSDHSDNDSPVVERDDTLHCTENKTDLAQQQLVSVFEETEINYLRLDLWLWFKALFVYQPYQFRNDPSMLLLVRKQISRLMTAANDRLQQPGLLLPAFDASFTDRQRYFAYGKLVQQYGGRVTRLTERELEIPELFFRRFFAFKSLAGWENTMEDWLEDALGKGVFTERIYAGELAETLELLEGLCEACWCLHIATKPDNKDNKRVVEREDTLHFDKDTPHFDKDTLHFDRQDRPRPGGLGPKNAAYEDDSDEDLAAIIGMICASMDAEKIFLLGKFPSQPAELGDTYDLLVLVKDTHNRPMDELESFIRNRSTELPPVHSTVMKMSKLNALLAAGNWYFSQCCRIEKLVYDAGRVSLTGKKAIMPGVNDMQGAHEQMLVKATGFLTGARGYHTAGEHALAAFMLHQALEHGINALLVPLMQFRMKTHNLHKLLCFIRRISPELYDVFPRDTEAEQELFQLLQKAYIHARYNDNFHISQEQSVSLIGQVSMFIEKLPEAFSKLLTHLQEDE